MKIVKTIVILLVIVLVFMLFRGCSAYNKMVKLDETVSHQWGLVENAYQRRADLIPSLVSTIKGSSSFEQGTLTGVIEARAKATSVNIDASQLTEQNIQAFQAAQGQLSSALSRLLVTIERYPDLKTTQQFQDMLASLEGTENRIALARNEYNESVQTYNSYIRRFPQLIFARLFDFDVRGYFKSESGAERRVDIDFSGVGASQQMPQQAQPATPAPTEEGGGR
ncbi:MAG: LemA family protein [Bacteroides sp.]